ncbi:hypothetical protein NQ315_010848 [Exocentrus adspersus]|uniref:ribonuclease H n=1 Tax=Exocentrus adspersus TaxID=1586481 RepID=A0AAV8VBC4_9CUCU|nr:hypothetical protein NQ315_010848 [Exocentrus adspersus]
MDPTPINIDLYKKYMNKLNDLIKTTKQNYFKLKINEKQENKENLWNYINYMCGKNKKSNDIGEIKDENGQVLKTDKDIANKFLDYFTGLGKKLAEQIITSHVDSPRAQNQRTGEWRRQVSHKTHPPKVQPPKERLVASGVRRKRKGAGTKPDPKDAGPSTQGGLSPLKRPLAQERTKDMELTYQHRRRRERRAGLYAPPTIQVLLEAYFPGSISRPDPVGTQTSRQRPRRPSRDDWKLATEVVRPDKIRWAINKFSPFKSQGTDGIYPILLQKGQDVLVPHLCNVFRACLAWRFIPEVKADPILGMPTDVMVPKYSFKKNFEIRILDREEWNNGPPITAQNMWYTDGSRIEQGGWSWDLWGRYATVFQAEVAAIQGCAREIIGQGAARQSIAIYSDSQAALKAIGSMQVCFRLVWDCVKALQELGSRNKLTLAWVPGHNKHKENEEADSLAREGAGRALIGPEPFCGIAKTHVRASIDEWMDGKSREWWRNFRQQRQAKMFIKERSARLTEDLLGQNRKAIRIIVGLLTGHCRLNKHMSLMVLAEEATCRFCSEEEETAVHVLCQCEGLARLRFLILGEENPSASSYTKAPLSRLWSLIQRTQLDRVL